MAPNNEEPQEPQTRRVLRILFTKEANALEELLLNGDPGRSAVISQLGSLTNKHNRLTAANDEMEQTLLTTPGLEDDALLAEFEKSGTYDVRYMYVKDLADQYIEKHREMSAVNSSVSLHGNGEGNILNHNVAAYIQHKFKPEITRKFDGNIGNWIGFWTQFERIHTSDKWTSDDKFEILLKGLKPESPAAKLISRFPPSAENYSKAVDLLHSRYGREEYQIEFYVRKLLSLVLTKSENRPISELVDELEVQLNALDSLRVAKDKYAAFLYPLVETAVPDSTFKVWERYRVSRNASMKDPTDCLTELLNFLRIEVDGEERLKLRSCDLGETPSKANDEESEILPSAAALVSTDGQAKLTVCIFCDKNHGSPDCAKAGDMTIEERITILKRKNACFRCLRTGHQYDKCRTFVRCFACKGKHYPLLCNRISCNANPKETLDSIEALQKVEATTLTTGYKATTVVYLQTLMAKVIVGGQEFAVRILIDSGSQRSYILRSKVKEFKLPRQGKTLVQQELFGGQKTAVKSHGLYKVRLKSHDELFQGEFELLDQEKICGFVPKITDDKLVKSLKDQGIILSDYSYSREFEDIDVLLGADAWPQIITDRVLKLKNNLMAIDTKLGWSVIGCSKEKSTVATAMLVTLVSQAHISNFWELELLGIKDPSLKRTQAEKDEQVNEFFERTVTRNEEGRYVVRLPWIEGHQEVDKNEEVARRRLISTTKRLKNCDKFDVYDCVIQDWIKKGIVELVPEEELKVKSHYLPHRAVFKDNSTTKVRPVFDASSQDSVGRSLNGCLEKGPNLIELIPNVITHWRQYPIGVSADIEKAFLMIELAFEDRDWLRFLWWDGDNIIALRHCRVVFGVSSSPYLLGAVLKYHLRKSPPALRDTAEKLIRSFYVDNCLTGVVDERELIKFKEESEQLLRPAGFNLRGWVSSLDKENRDEQLLGLVWDCGRDTIACNTIFSKGLTASLTRRTLLSFAHRLYDPVGFTEPTKLIPKIILQKTYDLKSGWDDPLTPEAAAEFRNWLDEIHLLQRCRIPRRIFLNSSSSLHVFCDASKIAFATCIFLRTEHEGTVKLSLLMAKARVSPKEPPTLPRLELLAALAGVRLYTLARQGLNEKIEKIYFWTDSSVVLAWITHYQQWSVFVENRVKEIREYSSPDQWGHIPGTDNPADLLSRGCSPSRLLTSQWWEGPPWLCLPESEWPRSAVNPSKEEVMQEMRKTAVVAGAAGTIEVRSSLLSLLNEQISDYFRIVKVVMHILDFTCMLAPSFMSQCGLDVTSVQRRSFTTSKFLNAEVILMRSIQKDYFDSNTRKSALKGFSVFYDNRGLLCVKSRVLDSGNSEEFNRPIVLPGKHPLVLKMIEHLHLVNHHAGVLTLMMIIREKIWLLCGRQSVGKVVRKCVTCRKNAAKALQVPIAPLPTDRTRPSAPFQVTGVDLAGPLFLRGQDKVWIVIFTCAVYRAVHLELVPSLSTEAFTQALRRFISRRGRPSVVYSDNGTNFVGLDNLFKQIDWRKMEDEFSLQRIQWKFNPPSAPWWGGFWERLIRLLKDLLKKNLGRASLNLEEMRTLLCECECIMNNRPLTYVSEDPSDLTPLRPCMFLQSIARNDVDDLDSLEAGSVEKNWKYLQDIRTALKTRFSTEYLGVLRNFKPAKTDSVEIGDVVLIGSDNKKRLDWPLGRVIELTTGRDGVTRLAKLKTKNGEILRPFQRLYSLELQGEKLQPYNDSATNPDCLPEDVQPSIAIHDEDVQPSIAIHDEDSDFISDAATPEEGQEFVSPATPNEDTTHEPRRCTRSGRAVRPPEILDL